MLDSTGKTIAVGDRVYWRSGSYTIKAFRPGEGVSGTAGIDFEEPLDEQHDKELPDEWSVDKIDK